MTTPELHLETIFLRDARGRIVSTNEPRPSPGPLFALVRGVDACVWAVHATVPDALARQLDDLAQGETPGRDFEAPPRHAAQYRALLAPFVAGENAGRRELTLFDGPAFVFPATLPPVEGTVLIDDERLLMRHFRGWEIGEIAAGCGPMVAIMDDEYPVSVCFSARRTDAAAEAGLETAVPFRRRGYGVRVTAAWAHAVRAGGRTPLYSTAWSNHASRGVARRLGLILYASNWSLAAALC